MVVLSGIHIHEGSWIELSYNKPEQPLQLHGTGVFGKHAFNSFCDSYSQHRSESLSKYIILLFVFCWMRFLWYEQVSVWKFSPTLVVKSVKPTRQDLDHQKPSRVNPYELEVCKLRKYALVDLASKDCNSFYADIMHLNCKVIHFQEKFEHSLGPHAFCSIVCLTLNKAIVKINDKSVFTCLVNL